MPPSTPADPSARVTVRPAAGEDLDAIVAVHTAARTAQYRGNGLAAGEVEASGTAGSARRRTGWERAIEAPEISVLCAARADGTVVGVLSLTPPHDDDMDAGRYGELAQLQVVPDAWGTGAGDALHAGYVALLRQRGLTDGCLWVWERNARARAFYTRRAWTPDGSRQPGPGGTDFLRLRLTPPPLA